MKKYLLFLVVLLIGLVLVILGLDVINYANDPLNQTEVIGSEAWCDSMVDTPNAEWTEHTTQLFSQHCLNP